MKKITKFHLSQFFFTIVLSLFSGLSLNASHMVGGEIAYEYLGNNEYEITLSVYRNCSNGFAAPMPFELLFILRNGNGEMLDEMGGAMSGDGILVYIDSIAVFSYPEVGSAVDLCWNANNICLEKGIFTLNITLPEEPDVYEIYSSNCCRTPNILNIAFPESESSTFLTSIPHNIPDFNNSAAFNEMPGAAVCLGELFSFDHSATDIDGDSLVYDFYTPLSEVIYPVKNFVTWMPGFNETNPLGEGGASLNPDTGELWVFVNQPGTYVIGIQVTEYRDGEAINTNRRDFLLYAIEGEYYLALEGQVDLIAFWDENGNGLMEEDEPLINQNFEDIDNAFFFSDMEGTTTIHFLEEGIYNFSLLEDNPLWASSGTEDSIEYIHYSWTNNPSELFFSMVPVGEFIVQDIDLTSSITRCNQATNYWLTYTNNGTTTNSGFVEVIPDMNTVFWESIPPADSTAGDTLYWFYNDLAPTHSEQIHVTYEMPGADSLGQQIVFEANIETWEGLGDDKSTLSSELVCSYDPNDKLNSPSGYLPENYTLFEDTLEYTIRFQNTGTDTAFAVIVQDFLSEHLDLSTLRPIASSHNVETTLDLETRLATFTFRNIYLPDSNANELASHGFVKYQIVASENIDENTVVENNAYIFFDENFPIYTNTVSNQMVSELPLLPILSFSTEALDFGTIAYGLLDITQSLTIENLGDLPLEIESYSISGTAFSIDAEGLILEGQSSIEIPIDLVVSQLGEYSEELLIESNIGDFVINLNAIISDELDLSEILSISPEALDFGTIEFPEGITDTQYLTIENLASFPLEIESYNISGLGFPAFSTDAEGLILEGHSTIEIPIYLYAFQLGEYSEELLIESSIGDFVINLSVTAVDVPDLPELAAEFEELDFGMIDFEGSSIDTSMILLIGNIGDFPLEIDSYSISGAGFSTDAEGMIVEGGVILEIPIYFNSDESGVYQEELLISSDAGNLVINLSATVIDLTGINKIDNPDINVYPNPNNGSFVVESKRNIILGVQVQNSLGEIVLEQDKTGESLALDIRNIGCGIYFVTIQTASGMWVEKIIVH